MPWVWVESMVKQSELSPTRSSCFLTCTMSAPMSAPSFEAFETHDVQVLSEAVGDLTIRVRKQGHGPPLLLLHGYPQTSQCVTWRCAEIAHSTKR